MAVSAQIKCINKNPRAPVHQRITDIGGYTDRAWKITVEDAIDHIESGAWEFYALVNGERQKVIVSSHAGRKYLKTETDDDSPDTLLRLPDCP